MNHGITWMRLSRRSAGPFLMLAVTVAVAMNTPAQAQMLYDPANSLLNNMPMRKLEPVDPASIPDPQPAPAASILKKDDNAPSPLELKPELDLEPPAAEAVPPAAEPLKAKAVMVDINSNTLNYDKDRDVYVATGAVHMVISEQNSELYADKVTYDQNQDLVIAEGNVVIIKDGQKTYGSYAKIDMSRKSALINDYSTRVEQVRVKAKTAFLHSKYVQYENGRIIITSGMFQAAMNSASKPGKRPVQREVAPDEEQRLDKLATLSHEAMQETSLNEPEPTSTSGETGVWKHLHLKAKEIEVHQDQNGYDEVYMKWPALYLGKYKVATMPTSEFSFDEPSGNLEYLGPDIGYDPDYGGMYLGPGWDFRVGGHSSLRFSPLITMGGGARRAARGGSLVDQSVGPGIGGVVHFRSPKAMLDVGYTTKVNQPVLLGEYKFGSGKTRLKAAVNEDYVAGFMGYERPGYGVMVEDYRKLAEVGKFRLDSYVNAGWFKDEFFPNYNEDFFVAPKGKTPGSAGRLHLQAQFRNTQPLLQVGKFLDFGMRAHVVLSGYTTGDFVGMVRGGPTMNVHLGNRVHSSLQYYYAATAGETPFVFDTYYGGAQNMLWANSVRLSNFLTVGLRTNMNLLRDNATQDLIIGNQVFALVGPKDVKFNLAYDVVRKRSYFGVSFFPGSSERAVDFEEMRVFQPETYGYAPGMMP